MSEMTPAMHHAITHPDESAIRAKMKKTTAGTSGITNTITNQKTAMIAKVLSNSFRQPPFFLRLRGGLRGRSRFWRRLRSRRGLRGRFRRRLGWLRCRSRFGDGLRCWRGLRFWGRLRGWLGRRLRRWGRFRRRPRSAGTA